jgi:hypothetical protein
MTKFTTLLISTLCIAFTANAQIIKGATLIGGQIFYYNSDVNYSTDQKNQKNQNATFNISAGRALKENKIFGIDISYSPVTIHNFYNGSTFVNTAFNLYSLGLFYRQYKKLAKDFYFFAETGGSYITSRQKNTDTLGVNLLIEKQSGGQLTLTPGISYKIYKKIHLEILIPNIATIQYAITKDDTPTENIRQKQFLFSTSLNSNPLNFLGVGFRCIF